MSTTIAIINLVSEMKTRGGLTYQENINLLRAIEMDLENHLAGDDDLDTLRRAYLGLALDSVKKAQDFIDASQVHQEEW